MYTPLRDLILTTFSRRVRLWWDLEEPNKGPRRGSSIRIHLISIHCYELVRARVRALVLPFGGKTYEHPHCLVFVALTEGLGYVRAGLLGLTRMPANHPLDGCRGLLRMGPVTGYGGIASSLKVLKVPFHM